HLTLNGSAGGEHDGYDIARWGRSINRELSQRVAIDDVGIRRRIFQKTGRYCVPKTLATCIAQVVCPDRLPWETTDTLEWGVARLLRKFVIFSDAVVVSIGAGKRARLEWRSPACVLPLFIGSVRNQRRLRFPECA